MADTQHRRKVGTVRPSHLMFTGGVGALIDLPNFPVLVRGLDDWRYDTVPQWEPLTEPRLLAAVGKLLSAPVKELRPPPWMAEAPGDPTGQASRVGVPVRPFPQWLRCTACNRLAPLDSSSTWGFLNDKPRRPDEAKFFHQDCPRHKRQPLAVAARFVLACVNGHLDDFPYREFVHRGGACPEASHPALVMDDYGGNRGANVMIRCTRCPAKRSISQAMGRRGEESLPVCRGRHPHLGTFGPCDVKPLAIVVGASNTWFAQTLSTLAVPATGASELQTKVTQMWETLQLVSGDAVLRRVLAAAAVRRPAQVVKAGGMGRHRPAPQRARIRRRGQRQGIPGPAHAGVGHLHELPAARSHRRLRPPPARRPSGPVSGLLQRGPGRATPRSPRADRFHPAGRARPAGPGPGQARAAGSRQANLGACQRGSRRGHLPARR